MKEKACCFIGHREIVKTEEIKRVLYRIIESLILNENVDTFLFGSKSQFDSLCYNTVTQLKEKHPKIKRVFVRAEYPIISDSYLKYLHKFYEETYYPKEVEGAGRAVYVKRNCKMIDESDFCVFYYDRACLPQKRKSGTKTALDYAVSKKKNTILLP